MLLCTPETVLKLLGISSVAADHLANTRPAIQVASRAVEEYLETVLLRQEQTDYFDMSRSMFRYDTKKPERFLLSSCFVDGAITIRYSVDGKPLRTAADGAVLDPAYYVVNPQTGLVSVVNAIPDSNALIYGGVSITYTSGFEATVNDPELLSGVPAWMSDTCAAMADYLLKIMPVSAAQRTSATKGSKPGLMEAEARRMAMSLLAPHARPRVNLRSPEWTDVVIP